MSREPEAARLVRRALAGTGRSKRNPQGSGPSHSMLSATIGKHLAEARRLHTQAARMRDHDDSTQLPVGPPLRRAISALQTALEYHQGDVIGQASCVAEAASDYERLVKLHDRRTEWTFDPAPEARRLRALATSVLGE